MNPRYKLIIFAIILIISGVIFLTLKHNGGSIKNSAKKNIILPETTLTTTNILDVNLSTTTDKTASTSTLVLKSTDQLFKESPDYNKSYLVYPTENASAKKAIANFNLVTKDLGNEAFEITLTSKTQNEILQSFNITKGQKVYFVEKSLTDDTSDSDKNSGDDYLVAVDTKGYILK